MTFNGWLQIALYCVLLILLTKPLGGYMTRVFNGERTVLVSGARTGRAWAVPRQRRR